MVDPESGPVRPEDGPVRPAVSDPDGLLKRSRELLDLFWEIAKPERETRLQAAEKLVEQLKKSGEADELNYAVKRLVNGLSHTREQARTGYSATLAQVLSVFEEISLQSTLDQIKEKHNLQTANKKQIRNVVFGNFFGVLALSQSSRLHKETQVLLECIKLLQTLSQYREHLRELPRKTMVDILSETSEEVFEEVLLNALQTDLTCALSSPEQLELLLVAMQKFPSVIKPAKLKKLLGTANIISANTLPRLVEVLKTAARSVKKESVLPSVALDLLHVSLREDSFELFWKEAVISGLLSDPPGPCHYLVFRLLGVALPLLSVSQLQFVLSGEVMRRYGEHVASAQLPERFKFSPEMGEYVNSFMQSCREPERQLTVILAFTQLTHQGYPAVPSHWKVVEHMEPKALRQYIAWLKEAFCQPQLDKCLEFSTRKQREGQESTVPNETCVFRFRKWIVPRLTSIVENNRIKKDEELVMGIARFIFFHAFFDTKKATAGIPETTCSLSVPLDSTTRGITSSAFYSLLQHLNVLPVLDDSAEAGAGSKRRALGVMADGSMWVHRLAEFADALLKQDAHVQNTRTFTEEHTQAWDSMLQSVEMLMKKMKKSPAPEHTAFQHLFLIVGIQMFMAPEDSVELLKDLRSCMEKAQAKKSKKKKKEADCEQEPHWVEVVVEILLSLLSQPSRLIRNVCKTAFSRVCPHLTQPALSAILNVLDPSKDEDESGVVVMDEKEGEKKLAEEEDEEDEDEDKDGEQEGEDEGESDSSDDDADDEAMEEEQEEVDQNFRLELMKVLQGQNELATEEDGGEDEQEMDDEAMMKLDKNLATLFGEQKKKLQAKKDEKERLRREKMLVRDFKIKVLDLVEVFLIKQGSSVLVLGMVEPLLSVIENGMSSESGQQEMDFLRRAAAIFRNQLCRGKQYCKEVEGREAELHEMLERLIGRAQKLRDSSVALYYFSAALYVVKVLRGVVKETDASQAAEEKSMGKADVERVTNCFRDALTSFMTRRKSPLTGDMFIDLFNRFPAVCVNLLDTAVENITAGVREHQQSQACAMLLRALQSKDVKQLIPSAQWTKLCQKTAQQLIQCLQHVEHKNKAVHERTVKALELCQYLVRTIHTQKVEVNLDPLRDALRSMNADGSLQKAGQLEDTYWSVMKLFGIQKPKVEKVKKVVEEQTEQEAPKKKKKGFLPESKKRKNRKKPQVLEGKEATETAAGAGGVEGGKKKKKKKNKRKGQGAQSEAQSPNKKAKTEPPQSKKQKKKQKQAGGDQASAE
ncbi:myb-binding protein 1A-like protein [Pygocentrus nattereri]|uniref:myb-binding protein 1A-like protein n=1 Tax=Pygocentrus nattereri TaxID=42514 RepID=UPI001891C1AA|nr:myb-binding protein 1A-like protein [Pygocentrus nattereri]